MKICLTIRQWDQWDQWEPSSLAEYLLSVLGTHIIHIAYLKGWSVKIAEEEDLKPSVVAGSGKRQRIMQTIGVTRGFGDFDLKVLKWWLVSWLVGWLDGWLVGWMDGWLVCWFGWLVGWLVGLDWIGFEGLLYFLKGTLMIIIHLVRF